MAGAGAGTVGVIWAQAAGGVIGRDGTMPWHLPEDLARFRARTAGSTVVMGRRTWEGLPERFRPLPGRRNVVLSRRPGWSAPGADPAADLASALAGATGDVWVIGGGEVYRAALPLADRLELTEIDLAVDGDTRAPDPGPGWRVVHRDPPAGWLLSRTGLGYRFRSLERVRGPLAEGSIPASDVRPEPAR